MRILFTGLGSIGSRHIKNLVQVLDERHISYTIDALRSSRRELPNDVARHVSHSFNSFDELRFSYDAAFITNPSSLHEQTIRILAPLVGAMFIEKPVVCDPSLDIASLGLKEDGVYYVACPLRHTPIVRRMKKIAQESKVIAARAICSSYLPDWRKGTDYRESYSAKAELGGGVRLDLIHELDYLTWLLGDPLEVYSLSGKYSALEIGSDDLAVYAARFENALASVHLDYFGRQSKRECELYTDKEVYDCDILCGSISHRRDGQLERFPIEDFYMNEMNYFVDCVENGVADNMNTVANALSSLRFACGEGGENR